MRQGVDRHSSKWTGAPGGCRWDIPQQVSSSRGGLCVCELGNKVQQLASQHSLGRRWRQGMDDRIDDGDGV